MNQLDGFILDPWRIVSDPDYFKSSKKVYIKRIYRK